MSWLLRLVNRGATEQACSVDRFVSEPPLGFVKRSDPNFYWLSRKF